MQDDSDWKQPYDIKSVRYILLKYFAYTIYVFLSYDLKTC